MFYMAIIAGLLFAYINGMHDGGTIVATAITSRLMSPFKAVLLASAANLLGALLLGTNVVQTMLTNIINIDVLMQQGSGIGYTFVAASFIGSILWNLFTWVVKLPSSASHGLIGAMIGAGIASIGTSNILWFTIFMKVILGMFLSPLLGFVFGFLFYRIEISCLRYGTTAWDKKIQILHKISSFFLALSYGSNDSQKVMGLILIVLCVKAESFVSVPLWVIFLCGFFLSVGTFTGGYNLIKAVGFGICKMNLKKSFASQFSAFFVATAANVIGIPISATQVVTSSIAGVGSGESAKSVNWKAIRKILISWVVTIPSAAAVGALVYQGIIFVIEL